MKPLRILCLVALATGLAACASGPAVRGPARPTAAKTELIPRKVLFDNPERAAARISPDGKYLSYLAPVDGVINVWLQELGQPGARPITHDKKRGVRIYSWSEDGEVVLYLQDKGGDENWQLHRVDPATAKDDVMTPFEGVRAGIVATSPRKPDEILISMNKRDRRLFDVYRLNLKTGQITDDTQNPGNIVGWTADEDLQVRAGTAMDAQGQTQLMVRDATDKPWRVLRTWSPLQSGGVMTFTADGKGLLVVDNKDTDTERLFKIDLASGATEEVFHNPTEDFANALIDDEDKVVEAVATSRLRQTWKVLDQRVAKDIALLQKIRGDDFTVVSRTRDKKLWVVAVDGDTTGVQYYLYRRDKGQTEFLFDTRPALRKYELAPMQPVEIAARDGLKLVSYLTKPLGDADGKLPMVLFVHGGPWARDEWGYNSYAQWLANRGYAVLQVNFRGSAGFGKKFLNAGNKQWGFAMQDDLTDAVAWAVREANIDPERVAIMGGSYGGYATLAGVVFTPDLYRAAIDIVGPSNIMTLLKSVPPYWKPLLAVFQVRVGDMERDREMLEDRSPLNHVDQIKTPLFIFQGKNDPRVKQAESDQIVRAIRDRGGRVDYVIYTDEGHGFARPPNQLDFIGRAEQFLAEQLGGRAEPHQPVAGATAQVN